MATICSLALSKRLTDQLVELDLVQLDEIAALTQFDLREIRLDRPARVELARALLLRKHDALDQSSVEQTGPTA